MTIQFTNVSPHPFWALIIGAVLAVTVPIEAQQAQARARDLGIPFEGTPGRHNAITDVKDVRVGHTTIIEGSGKLEIGKGPIRTGVTAILPTGPNYRPVFAAWASLNGNGEMTGTKWIEESGFLEEPILLTNTHNVGKVADASITWRQERHFYPAGDPFGWASLPVVAETWDGRLNDIHGRHVTEAHVMAALDGATPGNVAEGNVGGGTGMVCHRFKGGIGTASRRLANGFTVGVLVQANYGRREDLTIAGIPVGRELSDHMPLMNSLAPGFEGNSIIAIVATDAPLLPHQLKRMANRVPLGIGKTGGYGSNSSGDIFLAFSTARLAGEHATDIIEVRMIQNDSIDPFFRATVQATEEAIINALVAARDMEGINGNKVFALPHDKLRNLLRKHKRLTNSRPSTPHLGIKPSLRDFQPLCGGS